MTLDILVIDDNEDDRNLYRRALKGLDCRIRMAATAEDGLAYLHATDTDAKRPNLILLDFNLPDTDGLGFLTRLEEMAEKAVPVVMLTGVGNTNVAVEAMKRGSADYLVKDTAGHYLEALPGTVWRVVTAEKQRRQEQLLRQEHESLLQRNQALLQNSMDGIHVLDMQGNLLEANDAFFTMLGYSRDEAGSLTNIMDWVVGPTRKELLARFKEHIGKKLLVEARHRRKDGSFIDVELSISGIGFGGKNFLYAASRDITERKKVETILQRYKQVIESVIDGFWATDIQGNLLDANAAYARMSGYTIAELKEMHVSQLDAIDRAEDIAARGARIVEQGGDRFETRHRRKDGSLIDVDVSITYVPELQQCFVFTRDIAERKQVEDERQASEANLRALLDNLPYLTWLKDKEGRYIKINKAFADYLHLSDPFQAEGKTDFDLQSKELAEKYRADDDEVMTSRRQKHVEETSFDGKATHWVETFKTAIIGAEGKVLGTAGVARNITARKKAEEEVRIAAVAFETHDAILITNAEASIVRVNHAFTDITGYTPEDVLGQNPRIMSSGRQDKAFYTEMWRQLLHIGSWSGEIWDKRKSGEIYPKWMTITAVRNDKGETTHYVAIFSDITARKQAEEEIRNLAFYDALTRLPNRRLFLDRFRAALSSSARRDDYGAVLFIDLDRFKILNDTLGHEYGDLLLVEVAARIKSIVREMDTVARLGGDEFVVLLEDIGTRQEDASRKIGLIAEKIRETIAKPYQLKSHEFHSSPSIGISLFLGSEKSVDELLQQADIAMYQVKNAGRNAVRFFDPVMQHNVTTRAELEHDLHYAVEASQLELYYQLQVDNKRRPVGAEALLRWLHPVRGKIMPGQFIPVAEDSSLILEVGQWVLSQACRQLSLWSRNELTSKLTLAVNVSARQFAQPNFVDRIEKCIRKHRISPGLLKLELTEGLVLDDLNGTISKMNALRDLGIKLSMDDFGTGYSSLAYLKMLPLDQIKIDMGFVQGITEDINDALVVQAIISLADNFRMEVIAEGVETEAQLDFLMHHGCDEYQGYLFSKPVPLAEFENGLAVQ